MTDDANSDYITWAQLQVLRVRDNVVENVVCPKISEKSYSKTPKQKACDGRKLRCVTSSRLSTLPRMTFETKFWTQNSDTKSAPEVKW